MKLKPRTAGGVLYVHFTDAAGNRRRISTEQSEQRLAEIKALDIMREHMVDALPTDDRRKLGNLETIGGALRDTYESRWRHQDNAKGMRMLVGKIGREIGHWPARTLTYDRLRDYLMGLDLEPSTRNSYVSAVRTALTELRRKDPTLILPEFPRWKVTNTKTRFVSTEEEARILGYIESQVCKASPEWAHLRELFVLLIESGMRCGEALGLTAGSLRVQQGRPFVWLEHGTTKSDKGRMVPLTTRARAAYEALLLQDQHGEWTNIPAGQAWRRAMRALGMEDVTLHTLRHTCASRLVQSGVDLYQAAQWLGHSHAQMTERYGHLVPEHLQGACDALETRRWEHGSTDSWNPLAGLDIDPIEARKIVLEHLRQAGTLS